MQIWSSFVTDINLGLELSLNLSQPMESIILGYLASLWDTLLGYFIKY